MLLQASDATRLTDLRRSTLLFAQEQAADSLFLIEEGLVKLTRTNSVGDRIILAVRGAGDLVGEEVLSDQDAKYHCEAEVLTHASALRIPRDVLRQALSVDLAWTTPLISYLVLQKTRMSQKVELLCLHDVEYRLLYYLAELCDLVKPTEGTNEFQIPITQLELADLIGATRETTSTTLNQLERRGLIRLSRRMLTVPSPASLRAGLAPKFKSSSRGGAVQPEPELSAQPWSNQPESH